MIVDNNGTASVLELDGLPSTVPAAEAAIFRSRVFRAVRELAGNAGLTRLDVGIRMGADDTAGQSGATGADALDLEQRMSFFTPVPPAYRLDQLVLPDDVIEALHLAVDTVRLQARVFDEWNLRSIEPNPRSAINLHGAPGTGKTLAAHALAHHLGLPILLARTSQLESKYHGEGGKYLAALFEAARRAGAVLFIDEAESLLSRRFESVSQGAEHAVNTLRSELIMHLDAFSGLVVFATNLVESYDPAINSRLRHVRIPAPDLAARIAIWTAHLPAELPLAADVSVEELAATDGVVGRDIKRVVISAAVAVARAGRGEVTQADLRHALDRLIADRPPVDAAGGSATGGSVTGSADGSVEVEVTGAERDAIEDAVRRSLG